MQNFLFSFGLFLFISCTSTSPGPKYDVDGFAREGFGYGGEIVNFLAADNTFLAKGTLVNGVRNGTWLTYHPGKDAIKTITTYVHGSKNGVELTLNDRGQIESLIEYKNDDFHGLNANYSFGRATNETHYKEGQMHGPFAIYDNLGKVQRRGEFRDGKQHGTLQYFNEEGDVTLQYEYNNGEKLSGGIIEKKTDQE